MTATVTVLATKELKGATFNNGLWSIKRTIAGEEITFEAETQKALMDVVDLAVTQHLIAIAEEKCYGSFDQEEEGVEVEVRESAAKKHHSKGLKLWRQFRTLFRKAPAVYLELALRARGRMDPAGATGVQPMTEGRDSEPRQRLPSP